MNREYKTKDEQEDYLGRIYDECFTTQNLIISTINIYRKYFFIFNY